VKKNSVILATPAAAMSSFANGLWTEWGSNKHKKKSPSNKTKQNDNTNSDQAKCSRKEQFIS